MEKKKKEKGGKIEKRSGGKPQKNKIKAHHEKRKKTTPERVRRKEKMNKNWLGKCFNLAEVLYGVYPYEALEELYKRGGRGDL